MQRHLSKRLHPRMVIVLEECRVSPPPGAVGDQSLPLIFSDLMWMKAHLVQTLFFYNFSHSKTHFIENTIPSLKHSLSLTLKHFYPFAGNLLFPPNFRAPELHYEDGDSAALTFAESDADYHSLIANHPREVSHFHPLIPQMPQVLERDGSLFAPLFAVQVTLFPDTGISFGFCVNHIAADGGTFMRFIKLWGTIHRLQAEPEVLEPALLPSFDRSAAVEQTKMLTSLIWRHEKKQKFQEYQPLQPTSNLLATFVLTEADVQRLKKRVTAQRPTLSHVSSFTVTCAYTWACLIQAGVESGDEVIENEIEQFAFSADSRTHLDPPLPENYFGNCVVPCIVTAKTVELIDKDMGFANAASLIGEEIRGRFGGQKRVLGGIEKLFRDDSPVKHERVVGSAGSPRFAVYDTDFGFGKLQKREYVSIDETRAISLHDCRDNKRDIEIGLALPKIKMDAFTSIFRNGLIADA